MSVQPTEGGSIIDVHVNKLYEAGQTSMDRDPVERSGMSLKQRWKGPLKCLPCTAVIVERWAGDSLSVCQCRQQPLQLYEVETNV